jgi:integrase
MIGHDRFDSEGLLARLETAVAGWRFSHDEHGHMRRACRRLVEVLDGCDGTTVQQRWEDFEQQIWPNWVAGHNRIGGVYWRWGSWAVLLGRAARPSWTFMRTGRIGQWSARLPVDDALVVQAARVAEVAERFEWLTLKGRDAGVGFSMRMLLVGGYDQLESVTEQDLAAVPVRIRGQDVFDAALCQLGVLDRTPRRGSTRRGRRRRLTATELVAQSDIPPQFRDVTVLYLDTYAARISDVYATMQHKQTALAHLWRFIDHHHPEVTSSAEVTPAHARAFVPHALELARQVRRADIDGDTVTAHSWLVDVRVFFADICTWATESGSPFAGHAPAMIPLTRHDLVGVGFEQARRRQAARTAATVIELEREMPNIRAYALASWTDATRALTDTPDDLKLVTAELSSFWDWALLELLVLSGLRIEEACELTALDILRRRQSDGRVYYLLHVKPSKFDRARVIPIGDGLGRVLAEIVRHIKGFYGTAAVPAADRWDQHERRDQPAAPLLLQGLNHPSAIGIQTIRSRLRRLSIAAGARTTDGRPLRLRPHDCRRVFASEHLNNNTPPHVIQALLGHATIDTVMVYAKLYPSELIEGYRRALRGAYVTAHGPDALRNPTLEEWSAFSASCSMRDMGTHLCALPAGEHCPKGLVCLGCVHAQPKKSAAPVFKRMLVSHRRALTKAGEIGEPPGQIAARQLEIERIEHALRRAEELEQDVAAAIEAEAEPTHPVAAAPAAG